MPFSDWQFYVVTIAAVIALWVLGRKIVSPFLRKKTRSKKTTLTISGRSISKH